MVFTSTELANTAGASPRSLSVALQGLVKTGVLVRSAAGRYGLPGAVNLEDLVPTLDTSAYITGMHALYKRQAITQTPTEIICFTTRRHNRSRIRNTPLGRIVFVCVGKSVYSPPRNGVVASAEQALCDFVLVCRKRGVRAVSLVSFRNLDRLNRKVLRAHLSKYPDAVRREVTGLLQ